MKQQNNQLFKMEPSENAHVNEWKEWSLWLRTELSKQKEIVQISNSNLKKTRKDAEGKDKACKYYKQRILELEQTINNIKSNRYYRIIKFSGLLFSQIKRVFIRLSFK